MKYKKASIAFLAIAPLLIGGVVTFAITASAIAQTNKDNKSFGEREREKELAQTSSTQYKTEELLGDQAIFFSGLMPISDQQLEFINKNNNGITFEELKANYEKTGKVSVTEEVKKAIVDNYYSQGFFNNKTLEFSAYGYTVKYPQEALDLINETDESSYQRANEKIIELWKAKKFTFPWEIPNAKIKAYKKQDLKEPVLPEAMENVQALDASYFKYFDESYPLSPDQIKFINENNDQWTLQMIQKAIAENKPVYISKEVKENIIDTYFTSAKISFFKNSLSQTIWDGRAVDYPESSSWLDEPTARAEEVIKLWKEGQYKFPWEQGAQLASTKESSESLDQKWWVTNYKNISDFPNPNSQEVPNDLVTTKRAWSKEIFGFQTEGSHSYRIPGINIAEDGKIFLNSDKRMESIEDYGNNISQVLSVSNDGGKTWSTNNDVLRVQTPKTKGGLVIDGTMAIVKYQENGEIKSKFVYFVNIFAERAGTPHLLKGNPWVNVEGTPYWKIWFKVGKTFNTQSHVLKELSDKPGWWRMYSLPVGINHGGFTSASQLTPTDVYVDNSYNSETRIVTGTVYENVEEGEINNPIALATRKTNHSIWDPYVDATKYSLSKNNHNIMLESFDEGKTWTNFKIIDWQIRFDPYVIYPFGANGVGSGIQLKHQTGANAHLNGRIIFPTYNFLDNLLTPYYIYSDDFGKTWKSYYVDGLKRSSSESSFVELADGTLYWMQRFANRTSSNQPSITKSVDGGLTWINPVDPSLDRKFETINKKIVGNVFIGLGAIKLKGEDYLVFTAPKVAPAKAGSLYIMKKGSNTPQEIWSFDTTNKENFAYSYTISLSEIGDSAEILIIYEWSSKTKISNRDVYFNSRPKGGGIQIDKFTITLK